MRTAIALAFVPFMGCVTVRPPDLQRSFSGGVEVVVQKMQRPWATSEKATPGVEGFQLSDQHCLIGLALYPADNLDPFMAVFGAQYFFSEKYPGSDVTSVHKNGEAARATGTLAIPDSPPIHLEVRAWKVPGTETLAVVTGMWPDTPEKSRLQDFEAFVAGVRATAKKK